VVGGGGLKFNPQPKRKIETAHNYFKSALVLAIATKPQKHYRAITSNSKQNKKQLPNKA
jgi:hypothetical protein